MAAGAAFGFGIDNFRDAGFRFESEGAATLLRVCSRAKAFRGLSSGDRLRVGLRIDPAFRLFLRTREEFGSVTLRERFAAISRLVGRFEFAAGRDSNSNKGRNTIRRRQNPDSGQI